MTIQDQAPDLSICQEAQRKGVEIESNYYWAMNDDNNFELCQLINNFIEFKNGKSVNKIWLFENENYIPAPLTDEILEKLPVEIEELGSCHHLVIRVYKEKFYVLYEDAYGEQEYCFEDKKLSNALLRLAIKLKNEGML